MCAKSAKSPKLKLTAADADPRMLYEASVQSTEADVDFAARTYRALRKRKALRFREEFCSTAALACEWVQSDPKREAWGIDLDATALAWCRDERLPRLEDDIAERLHLIHGNVLDAEALPCDVAMALNFSYQIFKRRADLLAYFRHVYAQLDEKGMFIVDNFGGTESAKPTREPRRVRGRKTLDGQRIERFTYIWEHASFNPATNDILCHIHFKFRDGTKLRDAYTYDWRMWSIPELRELMAEAGFKTTHVYTHGWTEDGEGDGIYKRVTHFDNEDAWIAYVVGAK